MKQYIKAKTIDISKESVQDRVMIAKDPMTDVETLRQLSKDKNISVRHAIMSNPSTPIDILKSFMQNADENDQIALAQNPKLPVDMMQQLAKNPKWEVQAYLARNPGTPSEILELLYDKVPYIWMKKDIANNPKATATIDAKYEQLKQSVSEIRERVSEYVKEHMYNAIRDALYEVENDYFNCQIVADNVPGYDGDWCTGDYSEETESLWDNALDALVEYEVHQLFEDLAL